MNRQPVISIIIPAHNEEATLEECLASLKQLNYLDENLEIIVINDGSTDATGDIISRYEQPLYLVRLQTTGVGPSQARNMAMRGAKGEYVAFTDADCVVDREWLNELLRGFVEEEVAGVGGSQAVAPGSAPFEKKVHRFLASMHFVSEYMKRGDKVRLVSDFASCNAIYRKKAIEEVNGFDEGLWPGEDVDINYRLTRRGYKLAYNPEAVVQHHRPTTAKDFYRMMKRYGWSQAYLVRKHGFFRRLHYVPLIELLALAAWIVAIVFNLYSAIGIAVAVIIGTLLAFVLRGGVKRGADNFSLFVIALLAWNLGFLSYMVGKR